VRTGEGTKDTRQRQRKADLLDIGKDVGEKDAIESVIQTLVDGRLLVSDRVENQDVIDLSHEALMLSWGRFVGWRENDREVRRTADKVEDSRREWNDNGNRRRYLLEGRLLKDAKRLLKNSPLDVMGAKSFIRKSSRWQWSQILGTFIIPLFGLGAIGEYILRDEIMRGSYQQLEGDNLTERSAVMNLSSGCWAKTQYPYFPNYVRERFFGNCRSLKKARLSQIKLNGMNLNGSDLRGTDLTGTDFSNTDLSYADLSGAILSNAILFNADLRNSFLIRANLENAGLSGANLSKSDLTDANLNNSIFGCLSGVKLSGCTDMRESVWNENTQLDGVKGWENLNTISPLLKQRFKSIQKLRRERQQLEIAHEKREIDRQSKEIKQQLGLKDTKN
jgi:Pentapeptide repeats (8 copies)